MKEWRENIFEGFMPGKYEAITLLLQPYPQITAIQRVIIRMGLQKCLQSSISPKNIFCSLFKLLAWLDLVLIVESLTNNGSYGNKHNIIKIGEDDYALHRAC